ncbi:organic solute transporter Ostalpha-domain-containing protein [Pilaira anomala]|nr:organic solute transporter Ostalpha-domain-containing protein [Pilaira anomala]
MVPIYGVSTYISLVSLNVAFYVDTFRDIYEAFVIYAFFNLLLNKLGGERALIIMLHSRPPTENFFPGTIFSRDIFVGDPYTFLFVKRGILQFVYVKPVLAIITMILKATGNYHEGDFSWSSSYLYLTFFYNLSVCLSLWCLMVFFYATKKDLTMFRPLPKFLCVKAIIFFSFWQSVVVALLVSAGIIPEVEHVSIAIQDFLVCIEMVPFAIAHSFSFSYEDYFDQNVHSARMPVRRAIRDSFGLKDVMMDTLDTLRGSGFSYRSFEPSEGVPHMGSSRTSRIMAGLRYSNMTTKKHWIEPAPTSRFLNISRGMNEETVANEDSEPLEFQDPDSSDEMEILYAASRKMVFGDYNYPVIDFRVPLWRQARRERRAQRYGGISNPNRSMNKSGQGEEESLLGTREGCIDVIVKQGKGNYVVVDDLSDEDVVQVKKKPPSPPVRKPTLSNVHRNPSASSSTPTHRNLHAAASAATATTTSHPIPQNSFASSSSSSYVAAATAANQFVKPSFSTPHARYPNTREESNDRFRQHAKQPESFSIHVPDSAAISNEEPDYPRSSYTQQADHVRSTYPQEPRSSYTQDESNSRQISPSEQDAPLWQWPDQFPSTSRSSFVDNEDDLLSGDVWK